MNRLYLKRLLLLLIANKKRLYKEKLYNLTKEALQEKIFDKYNEEEDGELTPYLSVLKLFISSYLRGGDFTAYTHELNSEAVEVLNEVLEENRYLEKNDKLISEKDEEVLLKFIKNAFTETLTDNILFDINKAKTENKETDQGEIIAHISQYYDKIVQLENKGQEVRLEEDEMQSIERTIKLIGETENVSSTGFSHLDSVLTNNGLDAGEMCIFAAPPGWGKSITLLNVFIQNTLKGKNVVMISLENSIAITLVRLIANLADIDQKELKNHKDLLVDKFKQFIGEVGTKKGCTPVLKHFSSGATIEEIEVYLKSLTPKPDTIVIDYIGEIHPHSYMKKEGYHLQVAEIVRSLRGIGDKLGASVFSAAQLNRTGQMNIEKADSTDIASSFGQIAVADLILIFRQTEEDAFNKTLRMYVAKNRVGEDAKEILCKIDYGKAKIISTGVVEVTKVNGRDKKEDSNWGF